MHWADLENPARADIDWDKRGRSRILEMVVNDNMSTALLNLLFAQTIYKQACERDDSSSGSTGGSSSAPSREHFIRLAQGLKDHPLNTEFSLSPEACRSLYSALLPSNPGHPTPEKLRPLLGKLYESFKRDIVIQIKNDEHEFRTKLREIEQIERGKWDAELMKEMESEKSQAYQQQQLKLQRELQQRQELQKQRHLQEQQKHHRTQRTKSLSEESEEPKKSHEEDKVELKKEETGDNTPQEEEQEEEQEYEESSGGRVTRQQTNNKKRKRYPSQSPAANKRFQSSVTTLLNNISSNKSASFFMNPVNPNDAPNYYNLVHSPTDLRTIKTKIKEGAITSIDELERELENMFANAVMYNKWNSEMSQWTREMQLETESLIAMFRGVQRNDENKRRK